jgi:hypothetical protein
MISIFGRDSEGDRRYLLGDGREACRTKEVMRRREHPPRG